MTIVPPEQHSVKTEDEAPFEETMLRAACDDLVADGLKGKRLMAALFARNEKFPDPVPRDFIYKLCDEHPDPIESAIDSDDVKEVFKIAPVLAALSGVECEIAIEQIKEKFGKRINLNGLRHAIKDVQRRAKLAEDGEKPDVADIASQWASLHYDKWAYDAQFEVWRRWNGSYWEEQPKKHLLDEEAVAALQDAGEMVNTQAGLNLFERVAEARCLRDFTPKPGLINFASGTLDLATMQQHGHEKDDNLTYCLPYCYSPSSTHPAIDRFLAEVLSDEYARLAYMAHGGLALMRDTKVHQFIGNIGPTRGGKSTLLALLNALCGASDPWAFAGPSIFSRDLEGKRARFKWAERLIVAVDELPQEALKDEENLKIMTAHGGVEMRGIGKDEQRNNRWRPKLIFTTNDQPSYKDNSGAVKERAVFSEIAATIPREKRDPALFEKLSLELDAFAASCIDLALQVIERGGWYPQSKQMKALLDRIANESNPLKHFIHDECRLGDFKVPTDTLYTHYKTFCEDNGHKGILAKTNFAKELRMMNVGVEPRFIRLSEWRGRGLIGIRLKEESDPVEDEDFYQDDAPLTKPARMSLSVNGCQQSDFSTVDRVNEPVERAEDGLSTVSTVKESNSNVGEQDRPCEAEKVSLNHIRDIEAEKPLTPLTWDAQEPVERDEHVNGHNMAPLTPLTSYTPPFHLGQWVNVPGKGAGRVVHIAPNLQRVSVAFGAGYDQQNYFFEQVTPLGTEVS